MPQYLFTDSDLAAHRLYHLADVFAPAMTSFIRAVAPSPPELALDLGCGPGYTTRHLAELTRAGQTIGLDNSAGFLALAEQNRPEHITFHQHDLTILPFPTEPADLLYARYLLTHLPEPLQRIEDWAIQLRPGGLLLIEEVEWIASDLEIFTTYLTIVAAMLASQSTQLYLGPVLADWQPGQGLRRYFSRVERLPVLNHRAATLFHLNIQSWKHNAFIKANYRASEIDELEIRLADLADLENDFSQIEWGLRQIVFERE